MRKHVAVFIALVVALAALALTGCGGGSKHHPAPQPSSQHSCNVPHIGTKPHKCGFATKPPPLSMRRAAPPQPTLEMYDTITVNTVPTNPRAVAGYTSGFWPTYNGLVAAFPHAYHVSIAINSSHAADCLDDEPGDATPAQAPGWVRWMLSLHHIKPCVYASISQMATINNLLAQAGLYNSVRRWCAWYRYFPGLVSNCDAVQWTDRALNRNLDQSTVALSFFNVAPPTPVDPYRLYDKTVRKFAHGQHASEYNTTKTYDRNTCRGVNPQKRVCQTTDYHLRLLVGRLDFIVHHTFRNGHWVNSPTNYSGSRGPRRAGMANRLNRR